jgi:hypothetical protein
VAPGRGAGRLHHLQYAPAAATVVHRPHNCLNAATTTVPLNALQTPPEVRTGAGAPAGR